MRHRRIVLWFTWAALALACQGQLVIAENIALNPGFEEEGQLGSLDSSGWLEVRIGPHAVSRRDGAMPATGNWAHYVFSSSDTSLPDTAKVDQLIYLNELQRLTVSFDAAIDRSLGGTTSVTFTVNNANRNDSVIVGGQFLLDDSVGEYAHFELGTFDVPAYGPHPNNRFFYRLIFESRSDGSIASQSAEMYIDNVVVDAVPIPEPAGELIGSMSLLGLLVGRFAWSRRLTPSPHRGRRVPAPTAT